MHQLPDDELKGLILEETGAGDDSAVPGLIVSCINALKSFANFNAPAVTTVINTAKGDQNPPADNLPPPPPPNPQSKGLGMNLSYTINLNLPATSDIAVFNAIFKSLKENLLSSSNE